MPYQGDPEDPEDLVDLEDAVDLVDAVQAGKVRIRYGDLQI